MLRKIREQGRSESGFTLIELLVVILIIGILAAIAVPSFISQRSKAYGSVAKADAKSAQDAAESWYTDNDSYATVSPTNLITVEPTLTNANALAASGTADTYSVSVTSKEPGASPHVFTIARTSTGVINRTCTPADGKGGCKSSGSW